jgi:hypothetical protein
MQDETPRCEIVVPIGREDQFPALKDLLKGINTARKFVNLYGEDHPTSVQSIQSLTEIVADFTVQAERPTCVFTDDAVIVNDGCYKWSMESRAINERLRARGVMAISFVGASPEEQVRGFLSFLNAEPADIRQAGGPSEYLRRHNVRRIVATEAVYTAGEESGGPDESRLTADTMDMAIGSVIDWLMKQEEEDELPRLPIIEILSDPDMAAKLIREAVTKLHASRGEATPGELAGEVVHDLKDLAGSDPDRWDKATPQVRKAISKLPDDMRRSNRGFLPDVDGVEEPSLAGKGRMVDTSDIEYMVSEAVISGEDCQQDINDFASLLGAKANGLMSAWKNELEPVSVVKSSGRTFSMLMAWEGSPMEHGRIAHALAALIPRVLTLGDEQCALMFAGSLVEEVNRDAEPIWRAANARSAIRSIEADALESVVRSAMDSGGYQGKHVAASLVEAVPDAAISLVGLLGTYATEPFNESLKKGIVRCGQQAIGPLNRLLREGTPTAVESALDILVEIGSASAINGVVTSLECANPSFVILVLNALSKAQTPLAVDACVGALSSESQEVRLHGENFQR